MSSTLKRKTTPWWRTEGANGQLFQTKASLETAIRDLVARYALETPVSPSDLAFMCDVLRHHYDWQQKAGEGVAAIVTRRFVAWSGTTTGFVLKRIDGTEVDISWVVALMPGGAPSEKLQAVSAARFEVVDQRNACDRSTPLGSPCPLCGEPLNKFDRHVDHAPPASFDTIFETWMRCEEGLDYADVKTEEAGEADRRFVDREMAQRWKEYHQTYAVLRVIHKNENLRRAT